MWFHSFIFHIRGPISSANGSIGTLNVNDASPAVHLLTFFLPSCYHSGCNACVLHGGADGGATLNRQLDPLALSCPFTHRPICEACATIIMLWLVSFSAMAYQGDTVQPLYTFQTFKNKSCSSFIEIQWQNNNFFPKAARFHKLCLKKKRE